MMVKVLVLLLLLLLVVLMVMMMMLVGGRADRTDAATTERSTGRKEGRGRCDDVRYERGRGGQRCVNVHHRHLRQSVRRMMWMMLLLMMMMRL
uniref:Putative secreted protein n=1 Tax=Anopheles darlingi TaxID=43151 RepID=A0A2M4D2S3_ANODA